MDRARKAPKNPNGLVQISNKPVIFRSNESHPENPELVTFSRYFKAVSRLGTTFPQRNPMFAKARLDTLSDGIFAVAMTLLALDIRLPDDFEPRDSGELVSALVSLWPKFLPYVVSFGVLGLRWLANIQVRSRADYVNREYVRWWLLYLLLITCVPFSTIVVGRYARLAPSIWLYAGHTLLIALVGVRMVMITPHLEQGEHLRERQMSVVLLIAASVLAIVVSFVSPHTALFAFFLVPAGPLLRRMNGRRVAVD